MFKIVVYAYSQGIYSSRKIEEACRRDINFLCLLAGAKAPDHSTISRFRKMLNSGICESLFSQLAVYLLKTGEVTGKNIFIDGTKIESRANKYTFVWKKSVGKHEARMHGQLQEKIVEINREYIKELTFHPETAQTDLAKAVKDLKDLMEQQDIKEVHGRGKRKSQIQRDKEELEKCLERQKRYDFHNKNFKGRNSYSKTDPDATFMHMKDDHMRNAQLKPGYNIQIGVDSEYIMGVGVFADRSDTGTLIRMNRSIQVEGAFRVLKYDYGFRRFLTCGKINVKTEFLLLCMGYNINKLHAKIQNDRLRSHLFELKSA